MKTLLLIACLTLSGCSLFTPPAFDSNEYLFFVELEVNSRFLIDECTVPEHAKHRITSMVQQSETLQTYSYFLPQHSELYGSAKIINTQLHEISKRYNAEKPPSVVYCKLKTKTMIKELRRILTSAGQLK